MLPEKLLSAGSSTFTHGARDCASALGTPAQALALWAPLPEPQLAPWVQVGGCRTHSRAKLSPSVPATTPILHALLLSLGSSHDGGDEQARDRHSAHVHKGWHRVSD